MSEPHKKKVEKLNQYLDSLPVHFDIPKVRPRGPSLCRLALFTLTHNTSAQTMRVIRCVACVRACVCVACVRVLCRLTYFRSAPANPASLESTVYFACLNMYITVYNSAELDLLPVAGR